MVRLPVLLLVVSVAACAPPASRAPEAIRLVDRFEPSQVEGGAAAPKQKPPRTEWRFDAAAVTSRAEPGEREAMEPSGAATRGWKAGPGVSGLALRDGRLAGSSTSAFPLLHVEMRPDPADRDLLHAVEVRARVSAGANLAMSFARAEKPDLDEIVAEANDFPWRLKTPIVPGDQVRTYLLRSPTPWVASDIRHVLLRPTDAAGGRFEIESVRLIFRKEHLASIPSGVGWQGLSEIYQESLVARSPETIHFQTRLPSRPWLDLSLGTIEDGPVTFRVSLSRAGRARAEGEETLLLERTITRPHRWERAPIDLRPYGGEEVELSLSLSSATPGALGFWGSPVVRNRGAGPTAVGRAGGAADPPQGVIVIWADTLRRDHLDVYGYGRETAPHLRRMAAEGALFGHCVVQATWTKVSTPSLLTSLYPTTHGVHEFNDRIPASATTLAEVYRDAGYATLSMSSILFTGQFTNLHQGFEEVHEDGSLPDRESSKTSREYVDRLLPWLDAHRDVPFFVFLHVADPHDPYRPYPPYDTLWADPSGAEEHEKRTAEARKVIADPLLRRFGMPTREEMAKAGFDPDAYVSHIRDWYDGSIRAMDAEIGRLVESLRGLGLEGKTVIAFTGDHGEEFLEHGRMFHGQSTYGELTNAALILWGPGAVPRGAVIDETVSTIDLMPTLLDISRLSTPDGAQGRSLAPLLAARRDAAAPAGQALAAAGDGGQDGWGDRPAISEKAATSLEAGGSPPPRDTASVAITIGRWKLIHNSRRPEGTREYELYDARVDPLNRADLAARHPEIVETLARALSEWKSKAESARLRTDAEASRSMSQEDLERLRSLGYIQ